MNSRNKRRVLLLFPRRSERTDGILDGLAGYTRPRVQWSLCVNEQASTEQSHQSLSEHQWSGVISDGTTNSLVEACSRLNVPLIDITDGAKFSNVPKIRPNNFGIGQLAARDLKERGFEHFAFCGYSTELWSCERRDGFVEALALMGRPSKPLESAYDPRCPPGWDLAQVPEIAAFLKNFSRPTALMACNDQRAAQVLAAANELGISVPNELAVLGVNNDQARCAFIQPALSSIALNAYQTGYLAAKTLDQCIHGDRSAGLLDIRVDPTGVVTRQSTESLQLTLNFQRR